MHQGRILLAQVLDFLPRHQFDACVTRYQGNHRIRRFSCYDQFVAMAFAQLTGRESLRDIETCLRVMRTKLYHAGLHGMPHRTTLSRANERRDWHIWADLAQTLITRTRRLYVGDSFAAEIDQTAYAFDSTIIDLCLSLFPWAQFRATKAAIKLHTLLDLRGSIPSFISITNGSVHDVRMLDVLPVEAGSFYVMDRAYIDYQRLRRFTASGAFFVVRAKRNLVYTRRRSLPVDRTTGLRSDQVIGLRGTKSKAQYPDALRRITFIAPESGVRFVFLTNNHVVPALTVTKLYQCRWQVELFFKWIKQHLRIKAFFGTSENAVKTQIWIAMAVYLLVAIVKKELHIDKSLYEILQVLSIATFEKAPLDQVLATAYPQSEISAPSNQLELFRS